MNGARIYLLLAAISTVALTLLRARSMDAITRWWIPGFELVTVVRALLPTSPWNSLRTHLVCGLSFCLLGDLLINWTAWGNGCILFFAVTHLNLLWIFLHLRRIRRVEIPAILPWCAASSAVLAAVAPQLPKTWMLPALGAYLLLLDLMAWRALALLATPRAGGALLLALGGSLFFATDHLVILQIFRPEQIWVVATWICYPPALALLAVSCHLLRIPQGDG
jgi:uncharacterized membrane protein YhhN